MDGSLNAVFAVMPFADPSMPTLGVSLLKAACTRDGVPSTIRYFNIDFVDRIGVDLYRRIANSFPPESLVGEWFFADLVFGAGIPHEDDYLTNILSRYPDAFGADAGDSQGASRGTPVYRLVCLRDCGDEAFRRRLPHDVSSDLCLPRGREETERICHPVPSSSSAAQTAKARWATRCCNPFRGWTMSARRKETSPFRSSCVSYARGDTPQVPGIASRHDNGGAAPPLVEQMDSLPVPDFDEYFERIGKGRLGGWSRCTPACSKLRAGAGGAPSSTARSADSTAPPWRIAVRVRSGPSTRSANWLRVTRVKRVECVDNILDNRYISTVFPKLAASGLGIDLFYEVKANLRLDQLQAMRAGGMTSIQPGIESLSSRVLQVMQKGVSAAQNIQLLRWCGEVGINVAWNLLGGFPREPIEEYDRQAAIIPLLVHLQPPASCGKFRLDRFSPHFTRPESLGIERIRPMAAYFYVYPLTRRGLMRLAYYFDFDHADGREPDTYIGSAGSEVHKWWACRTNPADERSRVGRVRECERRIYSSMTRARAVWRRSTN